MSITWNSEYRMDFRRFVWHLEFSSKSGNHCSYVQRPAVKIKVDTSRISFNVQEAVIRNPKPSPNSTALLYCGVQAGTFCRFWRAFCFHSVCTSATKDWSWTQLILSRDISILTRVKYKASDEKWHNDEPRELHRRKRTLPTDMVSGFVVDSPEKKKTLSASLSITKYQTKP